MLDGLACLMVLHGLLKVTGVQRNPGVVGGVARQAAVGVDVDAQGSGLCEDESHFPLNARVDFGDFGDFNVSFVATY